MKYHMKAQAILISNGTNSADDISIQSYSSDDRTLLLYTKALNSSQLYNHSIFSIVYKLNRNTHALTAIYGTRDGKYYNIIAHYCPQINTVLPKYHSLNRR